MVDNLNSAHFHLAFQMFICTIEQCNDQKACVPIISSLKTRVTKDLGIVPAAMTGL